MFVWKTQSIYYICVFAELYIGVYLLGNHCHFFSLWVHTVPCLEKVCYLLCVAALNVKVAAAIPSGSARIMCKIASLAQEMS